MDEAHDEKRARIVERMKTPIPDVIAEFRLIAEICGTRGEVVFQIGRPYVDANGIAWCPLVTWGLGTLGRSPDMPGVSTLGALNMASGHLEHLAVSAFRSGGVQFYWPGAEEDGPLNEKMLKSFLGRSRRSARKLKAAVPED